MKSIKIIKSVTVSLIVFAMLVFGVGRGPIEASQMKPIVLKYVTFLPEGHPILAGVKLFVDEVNKAAQGNLILEFGGGPEAVPGREQAQAVKNGVVEASATPANYYVSLLPVGETLNLSMLTPSEERERGFYDLLNEHYHKVGLHFLLRITQTSGFSFFVQKPIEKPSDLKGLKLRSAEIHHAFMKKLGIIPVSIPMPEVYTALQRGLVSGFAWPILGVVKYGWNDSTKYLVDHQFYKSNGGFLINLKKWNTLPDDMKALLTKVAVDTEKKIAALFKRIEKKEREKMLASGMTFIKFTPEDTKWFDQTAYEALWEKLLKKHPEYNKIKSVISK